MLQELTRPSTEPKLHRPLVKLNVIEEMRSHKEIQISGLYHKTNKVSSEHRIQDYVKWGGR